MADAPERQGRAIRFITGLPEVVEATLDAIASEYQPTSIYFYVADGHLEVAVTVLSKTEIGRAALAQAPVPPFLKMRSN